MGGIGVEYMGLLAKALGDGRLLPLPLLAGKVWSGWQPLYLSELGSGSKVTTCHINKEVSVKVIDTEASRKSSSSTFLNSNQVAITHLTPTSWQSFLIF